MEDNVLDLPEIKEGEKIVVQRLNAKLIQDWKDMVVVAAKLKSLIDMLSITDIQTLDNLNTDDYIRFKKIRMDVEFLSTKFWRDVYVNYGLWNYDSVGVRAGHCVVSVPHDKNDSGFLDDLLDQLR